MKRVVAVLLAALMVLSSTNMLSWNLHITPAMAEWYINDADVQIGDVSDPFWWEPVSPDKPTAPEEDLWDGFIFVEEDEEEEYERESMSSEQPDVRYAYINRDRYIYSDPERTQRLGIAARKSAVRVTKVGWYANGDLYEIIFDTHKTAGKKKWETGYFYTSHLDMLTEEEAEALDAVRIVNGAKVTYVDFYYAEEDDREEREIEEPDGPYINDRSVNLRARADRDSVVYARLKKGTEVRVHGSRKGLDGNLWYKVSCKEGTGYVMASLVTNAGSVPRLDAPKEEPQTEAPAEAEAAAETEAPAEIEVPAETEAPSETEAPAETEEPVWTEAVDGAETDGEAVELNMTKTPGREEEELIFIPGAMNALDAFVADNGSESVLPTKPAETEAPAEQTENPNQMAEAAEDGMLTAKVEISKPDEGEDNLTFQLDAENAPQEENPAEETTEPAETEETEEMDGEIVDLSGVENPGAPDINESNPDRKVSIDVSWDGDTLEYGDTVTMSMRLSGYDGLETSVFWQCDKGAGFETADEYSGLESFDLSLDEENAKWTWRAGVHARVAPVDNSTFGEETEDQPAAEGSEETAALIQGIVKIKKNTFGEAEGDDEAAE